MTNAIFTEQYLQAVTKDVCEETGADPITARHIAVRTTLATVTTKIMELLEANPQASTYPPDSKTEKL